MINYEEKFYVEKKINAPTDRVWKIISKPGGLTQYHPFMKKHVVEGRSWEGVGSKDHLEYYSGLKWDREVMGWKEGIGFDLKVTQNGRKENWAYWNIIVVDEKRCITRITGECKFLKKWPFPLRWAVLELKLKSVFSSYLESLLKGLAYHAETGKLVSHDQFGHNPMFS